MSCAEWCRTETGLSLASRTVAAPDVPAALDCAVKADLMLAKRSGVQGLGIDRLCLTG